MVAEEAVWASAISSAGVEGMAAEEGLWPATAWEEAMREVVAAEKTRKPPSAMPMGTPTEREKVVATKRMETRRAMKNPRQHQGGNWHMAAEVGAEEMQVSPQLSAEGAAEEVE